MEFFRCKGGYSMHVDTHIKMLKKRGGLGYKQLEVINNIMLFKTCTVKSLRN